MSTELLPRILTAAIAERNTLASDITIDEENLRSIEAKLETHPTDKNLRDFARKMDDGLESDRKRMAKLDARIIKLSAELDPTQRDAHFATLESKKASVPTRMVKHAARVDTLGAQLESELRANVKAGAEDSKHVISAITGLAPGDPTSIARTVEMSIPHIRGHHAFQASALAALFLRLVKAMDCEYSMADFVIFNTSAINRTRTFAEVAEKSAAGIVARFDTVLADNGREPKPTTPAYVAAAGPNAGSLDAASIVKRGEVAQR